MGFDLSVDRLNAMTRGELCALIGIADNDLIPSSNGLVDIMEVADGRVSYGFLGSGRIMVESVDCFLARFDKSEPVDREYQEGKIVGKSERLESSK